MPARMEKIKDSDPSITVGGKPLDNHLEKEERNELEESRRQEVGAKTKTKKKIRPKEKFEDDPRKVSKRVRRFSDWEIRKEYGVKAKPFSSLTKNVMYSIFNAGDTLINSRDVSKMLERPLPDVSSCLSMIYKKLKGDGMIYRKKTGLAFQYCMTNEGLALGFEELFQKYFPGPGGARKKAKKEPLVGFSDEDHRKNYNHIIGRMEALAAGVFQRIEAIEQDGLEGKVKRVSQNLTSMKSELARTRQSVEDSLEDKARALHGQTNEFTINVRFLFGRA